MKAAGRQRRHRGSLRSPQRVHYAVAALAGAQSDPALAPQVALLGALFPRRKGGHVGSEQLARALAARHPTTGKPLRKRVNKGLRQEDGRLVSNVCHGFDIPLAVDKSISVAALLFKDDVVFDATMRAMRRSAQWLSGQMDRRLRRDGQNATVATGKSAVFFIPEKAGRDGQPHLHAHLFIPNLTSFEEDGRTKHCAGHFQRITRSAMAAQRRMNRQLGRSLAKLGYTVEMVDGVCRLRGVSRALCEELSPVSARLKPAAGSGLRRRSTKASVRFREDHYLKNRPRKVFQLLSRWQAGWEQSLGTDRMKSELQSYRASCFQSPIATKVAAVVPFKPEIGSTAPVIAAHRFDERHDDALDDKMMVRLDFRSVGAAWRNKLEAELSFEARNQVIELEYVCSEKTRHLVEHTEALRTLLRLIFPRLIVHQKFTPTEQSSFKVTGAAAANPKMARLVIETAAALEAELGVDADRNNWPAVLRWLHRELADRPSIPAPSAAPQAPERRVVSEQSEPVVATKPTATSPARVPALPAPPETLPPPQTAEPEWEMMP